MKRRALIIKNANAKVLFKDSCIEVITVYEQQCIGVAQINGIYLHHNIRLQVKEMLAMAKKVPLYFIDGNGTILAKVSFQV